MLDLSGKKKELEKSGYAFFVDIKESIPKQINIKKRKSLWNWDIGLK